MQTNNQKFPLFRYLIYIVVCVVAVRVYMRITDDFRISNITNEMAYHPEWEIPALSTEEHQKLDELLTQTFHYVGKGAQSYVFVSEDDKYVIKFFKFKHLRPSLLASILPPIPPFNHYKESVAVRKKRKLDSVFTGYHLAFTNHRDESGLFYIQLNPTGSSKPVKLVDKLGFSRIVDLSTVPFVIQEKCETLRTVMTKLLKKGNVVMAKQRIGQIFDLYLSEYRKGVYDRDHGVMHNTGFVYTKPIHLDIGKFCKEDQLKDPAFVRKDLLLVASKIEKWVRAQFPQYYAEIMQEMEDKLKKEVDQTLVLLPN